MEKWVVPDDTQINWPIRQAPSANLDKALLQDSELTGADLTKATLSGAKLSGVNLSGADLSSANLSGASLFWANLPGANLGGSLSSASLFDANLSGAILVETTFLAMDQAKAKTEAANLKDALENLYEDRDKEGKAYLAKWIDYFLHKLTIPSDVSPVKSNGCLSDELSLKELPLPCKKIGDAAGQKSAYKIWIALACQNNTEKHWVAQHMIRRAKDPRFSDFAPILTANLRES